MNDKNLLLGYGETLTREIPAPGRNGNKKHPYTYEESRARILRDIKGFVRNFSSLPDGACPNGKGVAKFVLHPAYLAKSYFPEALLRSFDLGNIGSKSVCLRPRKQTTINPKEALVTSCLYISGSKSSFESFCSQLELDQVSIGVKNDIRKLEDIEYYDPKEKIKSLGESGILSKYEVVIHTPNDTNNIINLFVDFVENLGANVDKDRIIASGGLTFLALFSTPEIAQSVSEFTFLRALRLMPELRANEPAVARTIVSNNSPQLPDENAIDPGIKVAVFDGGIGTNSIDRWCREIVYSGGERTSPDLLTHGGEVTSTILFGLADENTRTLPTPYSDIDHYRVLFSGTSDPDLFDVLIRIKQAIESNNYHFVNLSLGPRIPIDDDEVHAWTSTLEPLLSNGQTLVTVAVGNDGDVVGQNRIQPPSDLVNALSVGAASSIGESWGKATYSCIGPGRSPGLVKPDGLAFGGEGNNPFMVYSPLTGVISGTGGTSFAAPLALRSAIGLKASLDHDISPLTTKALLIHHAEQKDLPQCEIGWGRFPNSLNSIIYNEDNEATVIYQGELKPSQYLRAPIPYPDIELKGKVEIVATFCFATSVDPEHPVNYTRSGLVVTFRPKESGKTGTFFSLSNLYQNEQESRADAHKWETTLHRRQRFLSTSLQDPCFDIVYHAREKGQPINVSELDPLPYVLVVTIRGRQDMPVYNGIRQKYQVLEPIQFKQEVQIRV